MNADKGECGEFTLASGRRLGSCAVISPSEIYVTQRKTISSGL